ncbi:response regulator [Paenibacillus piscarius]|uniref:response regulator n=1 Tax=Paenibacillus piscarius TaxID=1089681 RepID=UPI001EE7C98A|nr:response regulator [Paenibacillus piscarius]
MYKVMIVEDEMLVRIGLKNSVEWSKFDLEVTADFPDGQAAWDYYEREKPDVVITDICMPKMDGMELIANIRKTDKDTRVVVLSCLEEFELARKALALDVSSYILKLTMTEQEIEDVLRRVREELDRQEDRSGGREEPGVSLSSLELVKEKMFKDFLFYRIFSAQEFGRFAEQSGLRLSPVRLAVCVMEVDRYALLKERFRDEHGHLVKMSLLNMLGEILSAHRRGEAFQINDRHYALVLPFADMLSEQAIVKEIGSILGHIQEMLSLYFNSSVSFGISGIRGGYEALPKLYAEAQHALEHKFISGPGLHHRGSRRPDPAGVRTRLAQLRNNASIRELLSPLKQKEYDAYLDVFGREIEGDRKTLEMMLFQFVQWISTNLYDDSHNEQTLLISITENLEDCDTLPDMLDEVNVYIETLAEHISNRLQMSDEITRAIQYIKRHYTENISLQNVADHVGLSFSYLSNLFRKELQISYIDYLNRYRIERAKELLAGSQLKSSDVAVQVGFSPEYTYFSKVFKKITGLGPNEYRRQLLSGPKRRA